MGKHSFLGMSQVAGLWREVYESVKYVISIDEIIEKCGEPDEIMDLGESKLYSWINEEWKGWLRGGTKTRKMNFVVKDGKVVSKSQQNLYMSGW